MCLLHHQSELIAPLVAPHIDWLRGRSWLIDPHKSKSFLDAITAATPDTAAEDILEQASVATTRRFLVEPNGFHVHHNLESVADLIENGTYAAEDTIRVFGQPWSMMGDEPSLTSLFRTDESEASKTQTPRMKVNSKRLLLTSQMRIHEIRYHLR